MIRSTPQAIFFGCLFGIVWICEANGEDVLPKSKQRPKKEQLIAELKTDDKLAEKRQREEYYELLLILADTIDQIDRNYYEKVSRRELIEAAIDGAVKKLDEYSDYIPPDELDEFRVEVENQFGGLGIQISNRNGPLRVISPLVGTPAYKAGIQAGDLILKIGDTPTKGISISDAVKLMKGRAGTDIALTVYHPATNTEETLTLMREVIKVETVLGDRRKSDDTWSFMYDKEKRIGYVRLTTFGRETAEDLEAALKELKKLGLEGFVLDLRFNPGGLLRSAIEVADLFLSKGTIVSMEGRNVKRQQWDARKKGTYKEFPMVVLVNQYSASASEIVAAALQDHNRATIIGQQTFGKASVQNVVELEDGKSAIKITTGSYQRPSGKPIHRFPDAKEWGVTPNEGFVVKLSNFEVSRLHRSRQQRDVVSKNQTDEPTTRFDPQLRKALSHIRQLIAESR